MQFVKVIAIIEKAIYDVEMSLLAMHGSSSRRQSHESSCEGLASSCAAGRGEDNLVNACSFVGLSCA